MTTIFARFVSVLFVLAIAAPQARATIVPVADEPTWQAEVGANSQVDFESFTGPVTSEYAGLVFSDFNEGSPASVAQYPYEGDNCLFTRGSDSEGGGGWAADFDAPTRGFAMWSGDVQFLGSTISFYDTGHDILATFDLLESGTGNGPAVYGFNGYFSDAADIARVEITIEPSDAVWFDNVQFGAGAVSAVPDESADATTWGQLKSLFQ